jgi:DNA-binding CsgD family transcriptional regulator
LDPHPQGSAAVDRAAQPLEAASFYKAWLLGDEDRCRASIAVAPLADPVTVLAQARLALARDHHIEVIRTLSGLRATGQAEQERQVLLGAASGLTYEVALGRSLLDRARAGLADGPQPLREEAIFWSSRVALVAQDQAGADADARELLASSDENARGRGHLLLSWITERRLDVAQQRAHLLSSLAAFDRAAVPDQWMRARALLNLLSLCRDLPLAEETLRARAVFESISWTSGLRDEHFQAARMLGWIDALKGDTLTAFRWFRLASAQPPSEYSQVLALLDRSYLAAVSGEQAFALDQLQEAHALAQSLEWSAVPQESRLIFPLFAEMFSDIEPATATSYLSRLRALTPQSVAGERREDPRVVAMRNYATGVAYLRFRDAIYHSEAHHLLSDAWSVFEDFGYGWRAALCALRLVELTGDARWVERARERVKPWPKSWVARETERARRQSTNLDNLSVRHREVLDLLMLGKQNSEIAKDLGRNQNTVRSQIAELFKTFQVKTRAELVAVVSGYSGSE